MKGDFVSRRFRQRGLSLVEMMVALLIGMLTVMVVVQLMSMYSGQQRSSRGVSDAQMNALLGLHAMEQDLRLAGHGLAANDLQNCVSTFTFYGNSAATSAAPIADFSTAAVSLTDGASGAPDTLVVRFAESVRGIRPVTLTANAANNATSISVDSTYGVLANDLLLLVNGSNACALRRVTTVTSGTALAMASTGNPTYNPPSGVATGTPTWPGFANGNRVYALGGFTLRRYAITAAGLVARDIHSGTDTPIAADIVDLQAQYGVSASSGSSLITQWVSATGGTWAAPTLADRKRIRAVRIALVARSAERAAGEVSPATIELWPQATTGQTSEVQTFTVPDRNFRYRVLRSVIPMKNLLWAELS